MQQKTIEQFVQPKTIEQVHLEQANRHIEEAMARISWLEEVFLSRPRDSQEACLAEALMHNMRMSLSLMIHHRLSIRRRLWHAGQTQAAQRQAGQRGFGMATGYAKAA